MQTNEIKLAKEAADAAHATHLATDKAMRAAFAALPDDGDATEAQQAELDRLTILVETTRAASRAAYAVYRDAAATPASRAGEVEADAALARQTAAIASLAIKDARPMPRVCRCGGMVDVTAAGCRDCRD